MILCDSYRTINLKMFGDPNAHTNRTLQICHTHKYIKSKKKKWKSMYVK